MYINVSKQWVKTINHTPLPHTMLLMAGTFHSTLNEGGGGLEFYTNNRFVRNSPVFNNFLNSFVPDCILFPLFLLLSFFSCLSTIRRWMTTGECLQVYTGHTSFIYRLVQCVCVCVCVCVCLQLRSCTFSVYNDIQHHRKKDVVHFCLYYFRLPIFNHTLEKHISHMCYIPVVNYHCSSSARCLSRLQIQ